MVVPAPPGVLLDRDVVPPSLVKRKLLVLRSKEDLILNLNLDPLGPAIGLSLALLKFEMLVTAVPSASDMT